MDQLLAVLVGAVGPTGGLLWFMYHTTSRTIPDMVAAHRAEIAVLVESFRTDLREERVLRETLLKQVLLRASYSCPHARQLEESQGDS